MNKIKKILELYNIRDDADTHPENLPEVTGRAGSPVVDISVSPDGKQVASVDGRIHIWSYDSGRRLRSFFSPSRLTSVSFTNDSRYVVSGDVNGNIKIWDAMAGKIHREFLKGG